MKGIALVITCEHAVATVPESYTSLFIPYQELLATHRGIDFGAADIARYMHQAIPSDLFLATTTRLLIDCNRSLHHANCFSEVTKAMPAQEKQHIINQYYLTYRQQVIKTIEKYIHAQRQVWHLSIHSFTPIMNGLVRDAEIGLLYDPQRSAEKTLAQQWKQGLNNLYSQYKIRMNYPYKGISDGFTCSLRKQFKDGQYVGIEVESNQSLTRNVQSCNTLKNILTKSLLNILN